MADRRPRLTFSKEVELVPARSLDGLITLDPRFKKNYVHPGGYSDIWRAILRDPKDDDRVEDVALKVFRGAHTNDNVRAACTRRINRESHVWVRLSHPNVLPIYGVCYHVMDSPALVSPYCSGGTASDFLANNRDANRMRIVSDVANGLQYLHANRVIHGDMKTTNVLIGHQGQALICDFGCAKIVGVKGFTTRSSKVHRFTAPELFIYEEDDEDNDDGHEEDSEEGDGEGGTSNASQEADVYAFAMVVLEILTDKAPFYYVPEWRLGMTLLEGKRPIRNKYRTWHIPPRFMDWIWGLLEACWREDPGQRPGMQLVSRRLAERASW